MSRLRCVVLALAACLGIHGGAAAQDRPMVFVHGFKSNGATWNEAANRLKVQLAITAIQPELAWRTPFTAQAADLEATVRWVPGVPFAVAHSNGGPVVREWSKLRPLSGLLTLSSPNQGAPIANNASAFAYYNANIVTSLLNVNAAFVDPNDPSFWIRQVIQGAMAFAGDAVSLAITALGSAGFDLAAPVFEHERVGSPFMNQLNSGPNLAREAAAVPNRVAIVTSVPDYHLGGVFRATNPATANQWRFALYAAVGTFDAWAAHIASSGEPRDIERAQRMLTASFFLSLHETMWCQAISDPSPYAVTLGGSCYPNDSVLPSWSHRILGALTITKTNMPEHVWQTQLMTPVLYEVLTTHMGVAPRGNTPAGSILNAGQWLAPGSSLASPDGRYRLDYQPDGNLVVRRADGLAVWASGTAGRSAGQALMQTDSNFVVYDAAGAAVWHTGTWGIPGAYLSMQNNGAFVIYRGDGQRLWGSPVPANEVDPGGGTPTPGNGLDTLTAGQRVYPGQAVSSADRRFALTYQTDGNLVLYGPGGAPRWSTQTFHSPGYAEMQNDGNFVVYASDGTPMWASQTASTRSARLVVHNDGNVAIYTSANLMVWSTGTGGS
jgi:predicted alpha/beta hydrolase family esterase